MTNAQEVGNTHLPPQFLRDLPGWVTWRFEPNGDKKPRKVPYYANGGRRHGVQGRTEDRNQLVTYDEAAKAANARGFDGVGFAPLTEFNVVALDFDNCVTPDGVHPEVAQALSDTYVEYSPSGNGIRAFYRGQMGDLKAHGEPYGFEVFSTKGYCTFTGKVLDACVYMENENTVAPLSEDIKSLVRRRFKRELVAQAVSDSNEQPVGLTSVQLKDCLDVLPTELDYDQWINVGMAIHHETQGAGFDLWDEWSQRSAKYTDRDYGVERWNSFGKGSGRVVTARSLVRLAHENGARIQLNGPASIEEFDSIATEFVAEKAHRFPVLTVRQLRDSYQSGAYYIKDILPDGELAVLFGESGSGKSFLLLDMLLAIALGRPWRGHRVTQGRVVYIAAEGQRKVWLRIQAYCVYHGVDLSELDGKFEVIIKPPNFLLKEDALDVARSIGPGCHVVALDTLAQAMPGGNENSGEDMGKALAHCRGLNHHTGALVILVHHAGKDATKGARGWSGLRAAADTEIEVVRQGDVRAMRLSKQKDGADGGVIGFRLESVELDIDKDGDPVTSMVCTEAENSLPQRDKGRSLKGDVQKAINAAVQGLMDFTPNGIQVAKVIEGAIALRPAPADGKRDTRKQSVVEALESMCAGENPFYRIAAGLLEVL